MDQINHYFIGTSRWEGRGYPAFPKRTLPCRPERRLGLVEAIGHAAARAVRADAAAPDESERWSKAIGVID
jgi:hypothetical protein